MTEIWKDIKDYEGLYQVSNLGRVRSLDRYVEHRGRLRLCKGRILKLRKQKGGYLYVILYKDGVCKCHTIHRLVAQAFIPNPDNLPCVNHKDENKENNCIKNLEWCDTVYNIRYGTGIERRAKAISRVVYMYTQDNKLCGIWPSAKKCDRNGFRHSDIAKCCNGKYKTHKGFKWSYELSMPPKALPHFKLQ